MRDSDPPESRRFGRRDPRSDFDATVRLPGAEPESDGEIPRRCGANVIDGEIARGGMGVVLRARDGDLGRTVAVKVLLDELADRPDVVQRFLEEAQICGQLQHPGIVPIYNLGWTGDGRPFFTMKMVHGRTLAELLAVRGPDRRSQHALLEIFLAVCQAVAYAHSRNVVHRDLKPSNVMVGAFGEVQVLDWGIAAVVESTGEGTDAATQVAPVASTRARDRTQQGSVCGTPRYMAPEQAEGRRDLVAPQTDVFSLGAMLCELLTGATPLDPKTELPLSEAIDEGVRKSVAELRGSDVDAELTDLVVDCLSVAREDRPDDAGVIARRVREYLDGLEEKAQLLRIEAAETRVKIAEERRARRLSVALVGTVATALTLGVLAWAWNLRLDEQRLRQSSTQARLGLREAWSLVERARAVTLDLPAWEAAAVAIDGVEAITRAGAVHDEVRAELTELRDVVTTERAHAVELDRTRRRDAEMVHRLSEVRMGNIQMLPDDPLPYDVDAHLRELEEAFRWYGFDPDAHERAPELLTESAIAADLALGLDEWAWAVGRKESGETASQRLLRWARQVDPDPVRDHLRDLYMRGTVDCDDLARLGMEHVREGGDPWTVAMVARVLRRNGADGRALETIRRATVVFSASFEVQMEAAVTLYREKRFEEAIEFLRAAKALRSDDPYVRNLLAVSLVNVGRFEEALAESRVAVETAPDNVLFVLARGAVFETAGRREEAREHYERALLLDPEYFPALFNLGVLLRENGAHAEAVVYLEDAEAIRPDHIVVLRNLGVARASSGRLTAARETFVHLVDLAPAYAAAIQNLGYVELLLGEFESAERNLRRALELSPDSANTWANLGSLYVQIQNREGMLEAHERIAAISPEDRDQQLAIWLALWPTEESDFEEAVRLARRAVAARPEDADCRSTLGIALYRAGYPAEALEALTLSFELRPEGGDHERFFLAMTQAALGRKQAAVEAFEDAARRLAEREEVSVQFAFWEDFAYRRIF